MTYRLFGFLAAAAIVLAVPSRADMGQLSATRGLALAVAAVPAAGVGANALAPINLDQRKLSKAEFQALPDAQVLLFKGQSLTAGQMKVKMLEVRDRSLTLLEGGASKCRAHTASARQKFLDAQKIKLNAEVAQGLARYRGSKTGNFQVMPH